MYQSVYKERSTAPTPVPLAPEVLVLGGGVVGITVAGALARAGMRIALVEAGGSLGGGIRSLRFFYDRSPDVGSWLGERIAALEAMEAVTVYTGARLVRFDGQVGRFRATVVTGDGGEKVLSSSAVVLATGCRTQPPAAVGGNGGMIGISAMEALLAESGGGTPLWNGRPVETITYLLDMTNEDLPIDSVNTLKQALILRQRGCRVAVCARDLKVCVPGMERLYRQAREAGVLFFKYDDPPAVSAAGERLSVDLPDMTVLSDGERERVCLPSDLVVVGEAFAADPAAQELCRVLKLRPGTNGRFMDDNPQLQRVLTNRRGIFQAGACRFPQIVSESLTEAQAVVQEVRALLHGGAYLAANPVAEVDPGKCAVCCTCLRLCPHGAVDVEKGGQGNVYAPAGEAKDERSWGAARIDAAACFGCGTCIAECPARAITLYKG